MKALIRWDQRVLDTAKLLVYAGLQLIPENRQAFLHERELLLTKTEFDIIYYLAMRDGRTVTYKELYEDVWKREYLLDDVNIIAHIHRIRKKLRDDPQNPVYIQTEYGMGYRIGKKECSLSTT